jgi:methionyl-tRNA formyltransferase
MKMQENVIKCEMNKILGSREAGRGTSDFVCTPTKINPEKSEEGKQFAQWLQDKKPDFLVVIAYGKIIPQSILDIPVIAPINVHGSLLPKYRGASPLQSVFLHNEKETGITIMKMNAGLDTGDMIDKLKFSIPFDRTVKHVIEKMQEV